MKYPNLRALAAGFAGGALACFAFVPDRPLSDDEFEQRRQEIRRRIGLPEAAWDGGE